ncbi:N-methyl-L-tryptophan oxidase [Robertmurraya korlensis]|uniref:N-methyl-L-tryptophan oxidase n=1 Tax=Robertmurraya korlensis TaxID=519977 RepID=UPI000824EC88|nr:N-methyl-L-tryptophan oxidase [Robertmurraya korlensis]
MKETVGVIGVGTMGSMLMWQLAKAGISVIGFEQFGIGHDRSAAGGESRVFRTAYFEGPEYVPLLLESYKLWRELEQETNTNLLMLNGGLMIGEETVLGNVLKSVEEYKLDHEILTSQEVMRRYPQHKLSKTEMAVLDKQAGFIRPELAVVAAAEAAKEKGAEILSYTKVEDIYHSGEGVIVKANSREYKFDKVYITAGPWTKQFMPQVEPHFSVKRIVMTWYPSKDISQYTKERFPVFARLGKDHDYFGIPVLDGSMVKISRVGYYDEVSNPDKVNREVTPEELQQINSFVKVHMNGILPAPTRIGVYMDGYMSDEHAIIGQVPHLKHVYMLGGYSGHGFKMAPVMGKIALDLHSKGETELPIEHLNLSRFAFT